MKYLVLGALLTVATPVAYGVFQLAKFMLTVARIAEAHEEEHFWC